MENKNEFESLKYLVDDSLTEVNVRHVFRGDKDICLQFFGKQDEECIKHNEKTK